MFPECLLSYVPQIGLREVDHLSYAIRLEPAEFSLLQFGTVLVQDETGVVEGCHHIEETSGVVASAIQLPLELDVPLGIIALPKADSVLQPILHLLCPINLGKSLVPHNIASLGADTYVVEAAVLEQVHPQHEHRRVVLRTQLTVPQLQHRRNLITLLPQLLLGEKRKLHSPVHLEQAIPLLLEALVPSHPLHKRVQILNRPELPLHFPQFSIECLLGGVVGVVADVREGLHCGEEGVSDHEVLLERSGPAVGSMLPGGSQISVNEIAGVLGEAEVVVYPGSVHQHDGVEGELHVTVGPAVPNHELEHLAEQHPYFPLILVPPHNVLVLLPLVTVLFVERAVI